MRLRLLVLALMGAAVAASAAAAPAPGADAAIRRALPILQTSAATFVSQRTCMSCHHNALAVMALNLAKDHRFPVDAAALSKIETVTFRALRGPAALDDAIQTGSLGDPTPNTSYLLMAAHAAGVSQDPVTGVFAATASAVRALQDYAPDGLAHERDLAVSRARTWLAATPPRSTEDAAFRVLGLAWTGVGDEPRAGAVRELLARQRPDGGWGQLPGYGSDAYSTGEALFALSEAGAHSSAMQRGVAFLVSTQAADGTWRVKTRMLSPAEVSPPYFTTGFPYDKDEYISYAGSCWAVMGLIGANPGRLTIGHDGPAANESPWARAALFGSAGELRALLDAGLNPNSVTEGGSTVLMMAAPDSEKVRLLLSRGADVKARTKTGVDALIVAASYGGTTGSVQQLLDAGAELKPPAGVHLRRSAIVAASMAGDVDTVRLLLSRGAAASAEALSEAITFGRTPVVQMLIRAGADVDGTDGAGINLLHWAVITNRPAVIPLLANAGVPVNQQDQSGFTPLIYAATIDFGDTAALDALLAAGAKRSIRNNDGRTALQQARHFKHPALAAALSK